MSGSCSRASSSRPPGRGRRPRPASHPRSGRPGTGPARGSQRACPDRRVPSASLRRPPATTETREGSDRRCASRGRRGSRSSRTCGAAVAASHLNEPRPDGSRRRVDRDRPRSDHVRIGNRFVARHLPAHSLRPRTPGQAPVAEQEGVDGRRPGKGDRSSTENAFPTHHRAGVLELPFAERSHASNGWGAPRCSR